MEISAATNLYSSTANTDITASSDRSTLDMNDFFNLLAAQLQNQSMFDSVDNSQFISQMTQFSSLSQMQELNSVINANYAVSLIGKTVDVKQSDPNGETRLVTGTVDRVSMQNGVANLVIADENYPVDSVLEVRNG